MKKTLLVFLTFVMLLFTGTSYAGEIVNIKVNGAYLQPEVPAQVIEGKTMVPLRFLSEALGAQVGWDSTSSTAIVRKNYSTTVGINTPIHTNNSLSLEINGRNVSGEFLKVIDGRLMVPLRIISENLGANVNWDGKTKTVIITYEQEKQLSQSINGKSPYEILSEAEQNLIKEGRISVYGNGLLNMNISAVDSGVNMNFGVGVNLDLLGAFELPDKMYLKIEPQKNQSGAELFGDLSTEIYIDQGIVYSRNGTDKWTREYNIKEAISYSELFRPDYAENIKNLGAEIKAAGKETVDGKEYLVLKAYFDRDSLFNYLNVEQLMGPGEASEEELQEFKDALKELKFVIKYYIDSENMKLSKVYVEALINLEIKEETQTIPMELGITYDINYSNSDKVKFPTIDEDLIKPAQKAQGI